MDTEYKTAVVTGGGSGIGRALALELAKQGLHVTIIGRTPSTLIETRNHYPDLIKPIEADIAEPDQWEDIGQVLKLSLIHI